MHGHQLAVPVRPLDDLHFALLYNVKLKIAVPGLEQNIAVRKGVAHGEISQLCNLGFGELGEGLLLGMGLIFGHNNKYPRNFRFVTEHPAASSGSNYRQCPLLVLLCQPLF